MIGPRGRAFLRFRGDTLLRIGIYSFASCEGCEMILFDHPRFMDMIKQHKFVYFNLVSHEPEEIPKTDISFVDGRVSSEEDINKLTKIRELSTYLVGLGSCSVFLGWYGKEDNSLRPITDIVRVDRVLPGCPINPDEWMYLIEYLDKTDRLPPEKRYVPVCVECPLKGESCLLRKGEICLGPITNGGCGARCTAAGHPCEGCRGFIKGVDITGFVNRLSTVFGASRVNEVINLYHFPSKLRRKEEGSGRDHLKDDE